ncbi:MAG TPA: hypothetical protein VGJ95_03295 [Pseudonocardiaceae bacterium]|jgi:hypothetical protein
MATQPEVLEPFPLAWFDGCDRCSAVARMLAVLPTGELLFCGHHAREHRTGLLAVGALLCEDL